MTNTEIINATITNSTEYIQTSQGVGHAIDGAMALVALFFIFLILYTLKRQFNWGSK